MTQRLTRRGKIVIGVAVLGFALGWGFGGRSLNVVVVPALVLVGVTWVYVRRFEAPTVHRHPPTHGHQGETKRFDQYVETSVGYPATVRTKTSRGLGALGSHDVVTEGRWIREDLELATRGRQTIGPTRTTARDPLGLWEREFTHAGTSTVIVFPQVRSLDGDTRLLNEFRGPTSERDRFDGVREYRPGDPLRDINWKVSAKRRDDLFVTEYAGEGAVSRVTIEAEAGTGMGDAVAEATASVAMALLESGIAVGLWTREGHMPPGFGEGHRRDLLEVLAQLESGAVPGVHGDDADIKIRGPAEGSQVTVTMAGDRITYQSLSGERTETTAA